MCIRKQALGCLGILFTVLCFVSTQEEVKKPTFPDAFEVEVQGIFMDRLVEVDGKIFYDKIHNRAAISYRYQQVQMTYIYDFDNDEFIQIEGNSCEVSTIDPEKGIVFFPFTKKDNKKIIGTPEEIFYFTNSVLDRQELSVFPSYVYTSKQDFPSYRRTNCDVTHIFSKPEVEQPDCDGHTCRPTLTAINIKCPAIGEDIKAMDHTYNFFRFRSGSVDPAVFDTPEGLYCNTKSVRIFPGFPDYFSFAYDSYEYQEDESGDDDGVFPVHKRVWYDSKLKIIRMDEFGNDGFLTSSRIFDFYGGTAYTIIASLSECVAGPLKEDVDLDQMTQLPKIFFKKSLTYEDANYIGQRQVQGLYYEVWSLKYVDDETEAMIIQDFYFINILDKAQEPARLQISYVNIYTYQKNDDTNLYELSVLIRLTINNFRSAPKEWEAFDVSSCFQRNEKMAFKLKVEGPPTVKDSRTYEEILEKMYMRLIITTNVSVVRINELTGVFDGVQISEFTGWILNKTQAENSETGKLEPDMNTAYRMIEDAAASGSLSLKIKKGKEILRYNVTAIENVVDVQKPKPDCFSGGSLAAASLVLFALGGAIGIIGYYVFLKRHRSADSDYKLQLNTMS